MIDELSDRITDFLIQHTVCVVSTTTRAGVWAMPVRYRVLAIAIV